MTAPFPYTGQRAADYLAGLADAAAYAALPPPVSSVRPQTDGTFIVQPGDKFDAAMQKARNAGSKFPAFQLVRGATYTDRVQVIGGGGFNGMVFEAVGDGAKPLMLTPDIALLFNRCPNVSVRCIDVKATVPFKQAAVYIDSCPGVTLDLLGLNGFAFGVSFNGSNNVNARVLRSLFYGQDSGSAGDSSGLYMQGAASGAEIAGNTFVRAGMPTNGDFTTIFRKHSIYLNEQGGMGAAHVHQNVFCDGATGINSRVGGVYEFNVFRSNGAAADLKCGVTSDDATVQDSVFFGDATGQAPFWGGGAECYSTHFTARRLYGFGNSASQQNPLLLATWDSDPIIPPPGSGVGAGHGPMPADVSCSVSEIHGVWARAPFATAGGRPYQGPTLALDVRSPKPGEVLPTLAGYYGVPESTLYDTLQKRAGMGDASLIVAWAAASWRAMQLPPPPVVATPAVQPAPFDISLVLTVDPRTAKYVVKPN